MDATATAEATEKDPRNPASVRVRESVWMRMRLVALKRKTSAAALAEEAFEKFLENVDDNGEPIR